MLETPARSHDRFLSLFSRSVIFTLSYPSCTDAKLFLVILCNVFFILIEIWGFFPLYSNSNFNSIIMWSLQNWDPLNSSIYESSNISLKKPNNDMLELRYFLITISIERFAFFPQTN